MLGLFGIDWDLDGDTDLIDDLITLELINEDADNKSKEKENGQK